MCNDTYTKRKQQKQFANGKFACQVAGLVEDLQKTRVKIRHRKCYH